MVNWRWATKFSVSLKYFPIHNTTVDNISIRSCQEGLRNVHLRSRNYREGCLLHKFILTHQKGKKVANRDFITIQIGQSWCCWSLTSCTTSKRDWLLLRSPRVRCNNVRWLHRNQRWHIYIRRSGSFTNLSRWCWKECLTYGVRSRIRKLCGCSRFNHSPRMSDRPSGIQCLVRVCT